MKKKKKAKVYTFVISFILIATFSFQSVLAYSPQDSLKDLQQRKQEVQRRIKEAESKEHHYLTQLKVIEVELGKAQDQLNALHQERDDLNVRVVEARKELLSLESELAQVETELAEKTEILNERVAAIYKEGDPNYVGLLLEPKSLADFMNRWALMTRLAEQDARIVEEIRELKEEAQFRRERIKDKQQLLLKEKGRVEEVVQAAEAKKNEILAKYEEKSVLINEARQDLKALEAMEDELERRSRAIQADLAIHTGGKAPSGRLVWPTSGGAVTSGFGPRWGRQHTGIDIPRPHGTPIFAAADGEVVQVRAGWGGGYGNHIVIYHGGGISTLYSHNSRNAVSVGQKVEAGQIIGYVGATGNATGPHLHFEVRVNGSPVNPLPYL
ncbi:murein DD-endopeptidase [Candidatus Hakubella thermalkaliphila]|uniref:Murein DD-endopeptidase n=3 Tax=Candidatus Hakubella thermalkaliphila TaxID=2754717 RepID=A0A6V8Q4K3_9ACTN|nr:peptidoglycan DD-metalloendopeptidase family protein [Candidatus Hakubella thermalkaliphila]GFP22681.1 murein DD-endopeptidase [Candidatus Hakubella thermalkaliphila]GFP30289.1 murein DD-endopeptidase [Candidatus Hakubella thermalkaliphila]GFP39648.1 murein DD-endopeptidase [Candidatus Hakubella thermalkaliphila]GFP42525.1 murein DD-endopeptidase [Candidatus Hakubella thermalkaliphila]